MNNNITSSMNSNSSSTSSSTANIQKLNGTTDNTTYYGSGSETALSNAASGAASSSNSGNEPPCNTCQRSGSSSIPQPQISSSLTNNGGGGGGSNSRQHVPPNVSTDEDEEGADSDDQYCVYTYKGDGGSQHPSRLAADLPSSFFKLHPSDSSFPPSTSSSEVPSLEPSSTTQQCCTTATASSRLQNGSAPHPVNFNQNNNNAMYSPDMDFLEMDFDPGGSGDGCCDGDDEDDDEDVVRDHLHLSHAASSSAAGGGGGVGRNLSGPVGPSSSGNNIVLNDDHTSAAVVLSKLVVTRSNGGMLSADNSVRDSLNEPVAHCSRLTNTNNSLFEYAGNNSSSPMVVQNHPASNSLVHDSPFSGSSCRSDEIKLRLVKSVTLPEMGASSSSKSSSGSCCSATSCNNSTNSRAMAMSISAPVFHDKQEGPFPTVIPAGKSSEDSVELEVDGVMIWSIQEAREISCSQIGRSACGATACLNVLSALGCIMTTLSPEFVNNCVGTRLREEDADLPEYLLSRSNAGASHEDLIAGIYRASNGLIYGRFFPFRPDVSPSTVNKWLLNWICKGAVPIATLNVQVRRVGDACNELQDSWHHQMIFGVTKQGIFLTNPLECVPTADLIPQLSSPSVLLIRRDDVTSRKGPRTDLRKLVRFPDPRWNEMNVLGQVSNMLLEEMPVLNGSAGLARRIRTTHISIPASYKAGITLFVRESNTTACALLKAAPEL